MRAEYAEIISDIVINAIIICPKILKHLSWKLNKLIKKITIENKLVKKYIKFFILLMLINNLFKLNHKYYVNKFINIFNENNFKIFFNIFIILIKFLDGKS